MVGSERRDELWKLVFQGLVDDGFDCLFEVPIVGKGLLHGHNNEVMFWRDPVVSGGHSAPAVFADDRIGCPAFVGCCSNRKPKSEPGAVACFSQRDRGDLIWKLVGGHELDCFFLEVALALEDAAVGDHLEEARVVVDGGNEAAATGLMGRLLKKLRVFAWFGGDEKAGPSSEDVGKAVCFFSRNVEASIGHAEGSKEAGLEEIFEGFTGSDFDHAGQDISINTVYPLGPRLIKEGSVGNSLDHLGETFITVERLGLFVEGIDRMS